MPCDLYPEQGSKEQRTLASRGQFTPLVEDNDQCAPSRRDQRIQTPSFCRAAVFAKNANHERWVALERPPLDRSKECRSRKTENKSTVGGGLTTTCLRGIMLPKMEAASGDFGFLHSGLKAAGGQSVPAPGVVSNGNRTMRGPNIHGRKRSITSGGDCSGQRRPRDEHSNLPNYADAEADAQRSRGRPPLRAIAQTFQAGV